MRYYAVYRSERDKYRDRLIARRVNRRAAVALASRLNASAPAAVLYYVLRTVQGAKS